MYLIKIAKYFHLSDVGSSTSPLNMEPLWVQISWVRDPNVWTEYPFGRHGF